MSANPQFDVVIPVHKKDLAILEYCIAGARKNLVGARRIITVSREKYTNNAEWVDEAIFPFSLDFVRSHVQSSAGWYFQQLLKMYSPLVIPDILPNVMILDSDTVFYRKVKMFDAEGHPFYNISKDTRIECKSFDLKVDEHLEMLLPSIARQHLPKEFWGRSGVSHNMIFNREVMLELFQKVEAHDPDHQPFYKIFLKHSTEEHRASEYQIYFNFVLIYHLDQVRTRRLRYKNTSDPNVAKYRNTLRYHYCSFHHYLRGTKAPSFRQELRQFFANTLKKLFLLETWNIGVVQKNISEFLTIPNQKIRWLKPSCKFRADPFGFEFGGKKFVLFESYSWLARRGKISVAELGEDLKLRNEKVILDDKKHLSFPSLVTHEGKTYLVCEASKSGNFSLYEFDFDLLSAPERRSEARLFVNWKDWKKKLSFASAFQLPQLTKVRDIFTDKKVVDPTILHYQGKWWIFYSIENEPPSPRNLLVSLANASTSPLDRGEVEPSLLCNLQTSSANATTSPLNKGEGVNSNLQIAFSDSLLGEFKPHPKNPVKTGVTSSRNAGAIFTRRKNLLDQELFRPAQNCSQTYGGAIVLNKITKLTEEDYAEEMEMDITPNQFGSCPLGIHTIASLGENLTLVDGKKLVFAPHKPLIALLRLFLKLFKS